MPAQTYLFPCLTDNFGVLIHDAETGATASIDAPVQLFKDPVFHHPIYLSQIVPGAMHNRSIWTMVAFAILVVFFVKGICDYLANYLVNYVGCSAVTDLRNTVFDKVVRQGAQFFEAHSTGRLMSSIMNDIEKIQVAVSHILADLLRQTFVVLGLLFVILNMDWKLAVVSLTVLPFVLIPMILLINRKDLMGEWVNPRWFNLVTWVSIAFIIGITLALGADTIRGMLHQ